MLWSSAVPNLLQTFFFQSFWCRLILIPASKECFSRSALAFLDVFWSSLIYLVVKPLVKSSLDCRHVCSSLGWMLWRGLLHHGEDSPIIITVVLRACPDLSMFLSSSVCSCFLRMNQTVDLAPNVPALSLSDGFVLFLKPNTRLFLYGEMLWPHEVVHSNSFQIQMTHLESSPDLLAA